MSAVDVRCDTSTSRGRSQEYSTVYVYKKWISGYLGVVWCRAPSFRTSISRPGPALSNSPPSAATAAVNGMVSAAPCGYSVIYQTSCLTQTLP